MGTLRQLTVTDHRDIYAPEPYRTSSHHRPRRRTHRDPNDHAEAGEMDCGPGIFSATSTEDRLARGHVPAEMPPAELNGASLTLRQSRRQKDQLRYPGDKAAK
ncbi:MAG: hypothetical protein JWR48_1895 [Mycobacterium sp.]|jgi:hypothetical protein|nr:hypothetical protein [Mycobacterium sp.]